MPWTITTKRVWYISYSCGNICGSYMYNRGTTQVPQRNHRTFFTTGLPHSDWTILPQNLCGIFFIPVVLTCTTGIPHRSTTELPQEILNVSCTTGLPQKLCGIFFIPVVISVVLTCTTQLPQDICVPQDYHTMYHRTCVVYFSFLW